MESKRVMSYSSHNYWTFFFLQAGIKSEEEHNNAKHILLEMGEFFQIQVITFTCHVVNNMPPAIQS